ncbi:hypothetical protein [Rhizobium sp. BK376]|uniref:hypothetical protein n=1 Tax=Rhizobium sp. BK376 TaxID=2512149 RepID=UPI0010521AD3|nr:hypothetical protein [Rhizobium sp. BK376]TCR93369.1 hypothetical protein EV561_101815 [Rhizobium sp. BK376]
MFAGRYLWWMLIAIGTFVFCAIYFDYVGWTIIQFSGCERNAGSCGPLISLMGGAVKPAGFWLCGGIVLFCMLARILFLRLSLLWSIAAIVWFAASTDFPTIFVSIWEGHVQLDAIFGVLPLPLLFLVLFAAYLLVPFEDDDRQPLGSWRLPRYAAALTAAHVTLWAFANQPNLPLLLAGKMQMPSLGAAIANLQPQLNYLAELGIDDTTPIYASLMIFACALLASLLPQQKVEVAWLSLQIFMSSGSPRRRSGRV